MAPWTSPRCALAAFALAAFVVVAAAAAAAAPKAPNAEDLFELSVVHINDFHARYEPVAPSGGTCPQDDPSSCVGGIARVVTAANTLVNERPNALLLNAGDNFQGTLWFSVYDWNVTATFLNLLQWDAVTLGNHEFDRKVECAVNFMNFLDAPVVVANIDDSNEPTFQGKYNTSIIVERGGRKIGIIGVITDRTKSISSPGNLEFRDVAETAAEEGKKLKDAGVDIIVLLSHAGIEVEFEVAENDPYVDIIVGGHSHTLLHTGLLDNGHEVYDVYPIITNQKSGRKVAVVQAGALSQYIGNLIAFFDNEGELVSAEGNTIYLDSNIEEDIDTLELMKPWQESLYELGHTVVGHTVVTLEQTGGVCGTGECNLGNLVTDAQVHWSAGKGPEGTWTRAAIGISNSGGIRAPIAIGNITYNDMVNCLPFENTIDYMEVQGQSLKAALEQAVSSPRQRGPRSGPWRANFYGFLQVSGLHVVYDVERDVNNRVVSVEVLCHNCTVPVYEPLQDEQWYPVAINSFLAEGGDGFEVFPEEGKNREIGDVDSEVFLAYLRIQYPVTVGRDRRVVFENSAAVLHGLSATNLIILAMAALRNLM